MTIYKMRLFVIRAFILFSTFLPQGIANCQEGELKATAKSGDGIHTLLKRHGLDPLKYSDQFIELNSKNIGKNRTLFAGREYTIPAAPDHQVSTAVSKGGEKSIKNYEIFGKDYSSVEILDNSLAGTVYYLLAGHGGPDPGATGKYGAYTLAEDEYAYDVTLRLARNLIQHGALVYMITRDDNDGIRDQSILKIDADEKCYPNQTIPINQNLRLRQRTNAVNSLNSKYRGKYQRLIVIHLDSRSTGENIDVFFYHHENSNSGKRLAQSIHNTFREKYRKYQPNRTYQGSVSSRSGLFVIRNTHPPTVFIELGNIRNSKDQQRFVIYDNRQAIANWIADGVIRDFKGK